MALYVKASTFITTFFNFNNHHFSQWKNWIDVLGSIPGQTSNFLIFNSFFVITRFGSVKKRRLVGPKELGGQRLQKISRQWGPRFNPRRGNQNFSRCSVFFCSGSHDLRYIVIGKISKVKKVSSLVQFPGTLLSC